MDENSYYCEKCDREYHVACKSRYLRTKQHNLYYTNLTWRETSYIIMGKVDEPKESTCCDDPNSFIINCGSVLD